MALPLEEAREMYEECLRQYLEAIRIAFPVGRSVFVRRGARWIGPYRVLGHSQIEPRVRLKNLQTAKQRWTHERSIQLAD